MKHKIGAMLAVFALLVGFGVAQATSAAATAEDPSMACSVGGYNFYGVGHFDRQGGTITLNSWTIGYQTGGPIGLEYRFRWFSQSGNNLIYDSGYGTNVGANSVSQFGINVNRFMSPGGYIKVNAGRVNDGLATCERDVSVP